MLTIKLARQGKKGLAMYRLIITEKGRDTYGNHLEIVGSYNPHTKSLVVKADRIKHWISVGAQMTGTVNNLLVSNKIIEGTKLRVSRLSKRLRQEMAKKAAEDKKKAAEDKKKEAEAKAEETAPPTEETANESEQKAE